MTAAHAQAWVEHRRGAPTIGIGEARPRLSWLVDGTDMDELLLVATYLGGQSRRLTVPPRAYLFEWPFGALGSREAVRLEWYRATAGPPVPLLTLGVEAGLLDQGDWVVDFASPSVKAGAHGLRPAYQLRAAWSLEDVGIEAERVARARLYSTAHGIYELELNGEPIDGTALNPGWTSYRHRLVYATSDLTARVRPGGNALGAWLADGWYRGRIGFDGGRWDWYGDDVALLAQLEVRLTDGTLAVVPLHWRCRRSPILAVGLYEGERYDARLEAPGWSEPGFDDSTWAEATTLPRDRFAGSLEAPAAAPIEVCDRLSPISSARQPTGRVRLDFGQNVSGKLKITVPAEEGRAVRVHHAEVLEGELLATRPLRTAVSVDEYVCAGKGADAWAPRFTLHGFRYAELENWPAGDDAAGVEALVVHTAMERTGWFECSDDRLNQLHSNIVWSMRDNFVGIPTDCPQRDERLGWTGDIQVFAASALFLFACEGVLLGWLRDVACEQAAHGFVPNFVPWVECGFPDHPTAGWGDAAVIVPWEVFKHTGDVAVLREQYASMAGWVDLVSELSDGTGLWDKGFQLGDWLDPAAPPDNPSASRTDRYLVATAYHARTSRIVAAAARLLGRADDAGVYEAVASRAAQAFCREYVSPSGRVVSDTPTALSLAIAFDLLPTSDQRATAGRRLAALVASDDYRVATGFLGAPVICEALTRTGHSRTAYRLLLQERCPSWLYAVSRGATTIWERWDSLLPDGSLNPGGMTSFNHYAFGAVAEFLHSTVAGLRKMPAPLPEFMFAPVPGGGITSAQANHLSPWGEVSCGWRLDGTELALSVELPSGTSGSVLLPGATSPRPIEPGRYRFHSTFTPAVSGAHGLNLDSALRDCPLPS
jgi:alpha-L-rhamnosidase